MTPYDFHGDKCLTVRQRRVLRWIVKYHDKFGYMPSFREIARDVRMSQTSVVNYLVALARKGALIRGVREGYRSAYLLPRGAPVIGTVENGSVKWKGFG